MPLNDYGDFECEKCGNACCIDGDGVKSFAYCDECEDYAEGFDGAEWFYEQACDEADHLRNGAS